MKAVIFKPTIGYLLTTALALMLGACSMAPPTPTGRSGQAGVEGIPDLEQVEPNPELSPEQVVKIQVQALQQNDSSDKGIEITFKFASPANKQVTGPLFRFKQLVKNPVYRPMLNHKLAEYGPLELSGDSASQRVTIVDPNGNATLYLFSLSRQSDPTCQGCWMTDSVIIIPTKKQDLQGI